MAGHATTPSYDPSVKCLCWLLVLLLCFFRLTTADTVKLDKQAKAGSDEYRRGGKWKSIDRQGLGDVGVPAYSDERQVPQRSFEQPQHRKETPVRARRDSIPQQQKQQHQKREDIEFVDDGERIPKKVTQSQANYVNHQDNAVATLEAHAIQAIARDSQQDVAVSPRSLNDWTLENFVIFVSIDGTIHARSREDAGELWSWETSPVIESKRHTARNNDPMAPHNPDDDIEWIVEALNGGQLYWYSHTSGLERLPFTVKKLVELAPYTAQGKVYNGEKRTEFYTLDARTGALLFTSEVGSTISSCRRSDRLDAKEDRNCSRKKITLGKTEYTIKIMNENGWLWTIKYVEWGPGNQDADLGVQYTTPFDNKYFTSLHDGRVIGRDLSRPGKKETLSYTFESPVIRGFDVATSVQVDPFEDQVSLILLPHPVDNSASKTGDEKCYISYFGESGYFAMSERDYPEITMDAEDSVGSPAPSEEGWSHMNDSDRKNFLAGVHTLERQHRFIQTTPRLDAGEAQEMVRQAPQHMIPPAVPGNEPQKLLPSREGEIMAKKWSHRTIIEAGLAVMALLVFVYNLNSRAPIAALFSKRLLAKVANTIETSKVEVMDVRQDLEILPEVAASPAALAEKAEPIENSVKVQTQTIAVEPEPVKAVEPTVRFAELPEGERINDSKEETESATPTLKKTSRRGKRGAGKKKKEAQARKRDGESGDDAEGTSKSNDADKENMDPATTTVIPDPEPLQDHPDGVVAGDLLVTNEVLGYGSHGTTVFRGTFEGKDVAVKRMLISFFDVASHEVALLQESDDHPNVVRYYCKQQKGQFLYIALELCPASLYDVIDRPTNFEAIVQHMDPPDVLYQITLGLQYLHSLKIVHRDIKPQNILVTAPKRNLREPTKITPPRLLISDFGLCKKLDPDQSSFRATTAHAAGTTGWRAPELLVAEEGGTPLIPTNGGVEGNTTGSTSDSVILDTLTNRRATRAIDIFSLGCVFYYVLTRGEHPFGERYMREANIIHGKQQMTALDILGDAGLEAKDLISRMIDRNPKARPDASTVLMHPFFWTPEKKLSFLLDVSDRFEVEEREPPSPLLQLLENGAQDVLGADWLKSLDKVFIDNLGKYRKYNGGKMLDLLRALRNKKHHYQDLPGNVKASLGDMPAGFLSYFTRRFPRLILHTYYVVRESELRWEPSFRSIFSTDT